MADFVRRLVSGPKARFKDGALNVELDLVYLTDHVIIMGYPAAGIEGLYRNRREDAQKFLENRHGKNYWVFNMCPIRENSYPASVFGGRVSRYPFPDHHAPPLAILPLVAREMRAWINGSKDRVAVVHCKAGKGRSGTIACSYLLALDDSPSPPKLQRSYSAKEWAKIRADDVMQAVPEDDDTGFQEQKNNNNQDNDENNNTSLRAPEEPKSMSNTHTTETPPVPSPSIPPITITSTTSSSDNHQHHSFSGSLKNVLDLHTSRRMKPTAPSSTKPKLNTSDSKPDSSPITSKQGVSIPSQRRWLYYWSLLLSNEFPSNFWSLTPSHALPQTPKVVLTQIKLRMKETSGMKLNIIKAASLIIDRTNRSNPLHPAGEGRVWVSLARYDDDLVNLLESWERHTRDGVYIGRRKKGSDHMDDEPLSKIFGEDGKWDKSKMVKSFKRLGLVDEGAVKREASSDKDDTKIISYTLRPLSEAKWADIRDQFQREDDIPSSESQQISNNAPSAANSMYDVVMPPPVKNHSKDSEGVVLDANREVRVKLYMGQVFMGWLWFIPTFHIPPPNRSSQPSTPSKFILTRKEIDFPLGIGSDIIDVEISLQWCPEETPDVAVQPQVSTAQTSDEESKGQEVRGGGKSEGDMAGLAASVQAMAAGDVDVGGAVEVKQAAED